MRAFLAVLAVAAITPQGAAVARTLDQARRVCLDVDHNDTAFADACTQMIESPSATSRERAIALNNRATVSEESQRTLRDRDQAIALAPGIAKLFNNRGLALLSDDPRRALADFDSAIRLAPRYLTPLYNPYADRAEAREARCDRAGAARDRALMRPL